LTASSEASAQINSHYQNARSETPQLDSAEIFIVTHLGGSQRMITAAYGPLA
jgi:hypothetical protein